MMSMTALMSCSLRAYHYRENDVHVFSDEVAYSLLGKKYYEIYESLASGADFFCRVLRGIRRTVFV